MRRISVVAAALWLLTAAALPAQEDAEGCKDHPLFTRLPGTHIIDCESTQFDLRRFPTGAAKGDQSTTPVDVEGPVQWISYELDEGATPASGLQIQRNFENAARKAGGTVEGSYPGWCNANYDAEAMPRMGNGCTTYALTLKLVRGGRESWVFIQAGEKDGSYLMTVSERDAMRQEISVKELADTLVKDGFVTLHVNFDTGKATITPDSATILDNAAAALKAAADLKVEVGGHTDNAGTPEANQRLSEERARAVMAALVQRGIAADRLTARGYGQNVPVADNRSEEGRAKNRRVELTKK